MKHSIAPSTPLWHWITATALRLGLAGASLAAATIAHAGAWVTVPPFDGARAQHTATLLHDGRVWMAGGTSGEEDGGGNAVALASTRLFSPATRTWANGPDLPVGRYAHTATPLADGTVLLVGGRASDGEPLTVEQAAVTYDPVTNTLTATGAMHLRRSYHTATRLRDGRVFIAGGQEGVAGEPAPTQIEIYDPTARTWTLRDLSLSALPGRRSEHTTTVLRDGRVLVVGGFDDDGLRTRSAFVSDLLDWTPVDMPPEAPARAGHTATQLSDGRVLIAGGTDAGPNSPTYLFDPASNSWSPGPELGTGHPWAAAASLSSSNVLLTGGASVGPSALAISALAVTITVTPDGTTVTPQPDMSVARAKHTATALPNGQVLVLGGVTSISYTATPTAELYTHGTFIPHTVPMLSQWNLLLLTGSMVLAGLLWRRTFRT